MAQWVKDLVLALLWLRLLLWREFGPWCRFGPQVQTKKKVNLHLIYTMLMLVNKKDKMKQAKVFVISKSL